MPDGIVPEDAIAEITGYKVRPRQIAVLEHLGIDHFVAPTGRPIVLWSALRERNGKGARRTGPRLEGLARR